MSEGLLRVACLRKSFGALHASDGIDLEVLEGETHAIIGPNGAGKTTLISQLAGSLRPDAGAIRFSGEDITGLSAPRREGSADTFHGFRGKPRPGRIDWILYRGMRPQSVETITANDGGRYPSDHFPVLAEFVQD